MFAYRTKYYQYKLHLQWSLSGLWTGFTRFNWVIKFVLEISECLLRAINLFFVCPLCRYYLFNTYAISSMHQPRNLSVMLCCCKNHRRGTVYKLPYDWYWNSTVRQKINSKSIFRIGALTMWTRQNFFSSLCRKFHINTQHSQAKIIGPSTRQPSGSGCWRHKVIELKVFSRYTLRTTIWSTNCTFVSQTVTDHKRMVSQSYFTCVGAAMWPCIQCIILRLGVNSVWNISSGPARSSVSSAEPCPR